MHQRHKSSSQEVLVYADNVAVVLDTDQELQNVASTWASSIKNNGMKINTAKGKTEFMHIGRTKRELDICMDSERLHQAESYKCLEVVIDEGNYQEAEINARIEK